MTAGRNKIVIANPVPPKPAALILVAAIRSHR
jgi:hypothetical protein